MKEFDFLFRIIFFIFLDCYDVLVLKIIFKNKKISLNIFLNKKIF